MNGHVVTYAPPAVLRGLVDADEPGVYVVTCIRQGLWHHFRRPAGPPNVPTRRRPTRQLRALPYPAPWRWQARHCPVADNGQYGRPEDAGEGLL